MAMLARSKQEKRGVACVVSPRGGQASISPEARAQLCRPTPGLVRRGDAASNRQGEAVSEHFAQVRDKIAPATVNVHDRMLLVPRS